MMLLSNKYYCSLGTVMLVSLVWTVCITAQTEKKDQDIFPEGEWSITYLIQDPQKMLVASSIKSSGFEQIVQAVHRGFIITVKSNPAPILLEQAFDFKAHTLPDALQDQDLSTRLKECKTQNQCVREVLAWIEKVAPYSTDPLESQSWDTVLKNRKGNCLGRVNLLSEVLKALDIQNNPVTGVVVKNGSAVFHRWIEIDYSGMGVFPSDPGVSMDLILPDHMVLSIKETAPENLNDVKDLGVVIQKSEEYKRFNFTDVRKWAQSDHPGLICRKTTQDQYSTALWGLVTTPMKGLVDLHLSSGGVDYQTRVDEFGNFSFPGINDGNYTLEVKPSWTRAMTKEGVVVPRKSSKITIEISENIH